MKEFEFIIVASGIDISGDEGVDRFFEAGCDDATISLQNGVIILDFCREAKNYVHALVSAWRDVRKAGANVLRVEPDVLVSLSDIAERLNETRAAVSNYSQGKRRSGFPKPVARITTGSPMWDWEDVARWAHKNDKATIETIVEVRTVKAVNTFAYHHFEVRSDVPFAGYAPLQAALSATV